MARGNTFSLTVMVIILAMLGLFVGYLLGNWFIQLVTGESPGTRQVVENKVVEEEIIVEDDKAESSTNDLESVQDEFILEQGEFILEDEQKPVREQIKGDVYVVQVGAFQSYENALTLKEQLAKDGFQAVITEGVPYKVQLGATIDRKVAEETEKKLEALGYDAFITH